MKKSTNLFANAIVLVLCLLLFATLSIAQEQSISPADAKKYEGEKKIVCGMVVGATHAIRTKGQPTFLNLDQPYPNEIFTVLIWGSDRKKFGNPPEAFYKGKTICVTGKIKSYKGKPQIVVNAPAQIKISY
jgi:DNA/RNA endonuclease YhcR with UshA esterase domain